MTAEGGPETAGFQVGSFVSPLTASTANALLDDADPALSLLLKYFAAVLSIHLGARWDAEVVKSGLSSLVGKISSLQIPYDPLPFIHSTQLAPPLLALYPVSDDMSRDEHTRHWYKLDGTMRLMWVLPPLAAAQFLQLYPFLRAATKVVLDRTEQGYDPAYNGGQVGDSNAIMELSLTRATYGSIPGLRGERSSPTEMHFPCVALDLTIVERRQSAPGQGALAGVDTTVQVQPPAHGTVVTLIETSTNFP